MNTFIHGKVKDHYDRKRKKTNRNIKLDLDSILKYEHMDINGLTTKFHYLKGDHFGEGCLVENASNCRDHSVQAISAVYGYYFPKSLLLSSLKFTKEEKAKEVRISIVGRNHHVS